MLPSTSFNSSKSMSSPFNSKSPRYPSAPRTCSMCWLRVTPMVLTSRALLMFANGSKNRTRSASLSPLKARPVRVATRNASNPAVIASGLFMANTKPGIRPSVCPAIRAVSASAMRCAFESRAAICLGTRPADKAAAPTVWPTPVRAAAAAPSPKIQAPVSTKFARDSTPRTPLAHISRSVLPTVTLPTTLESLTYCAYSEGLRPTAAKNESVESLSFITSCVTRFRGVPTNPMLNDIP